VETLKLTEKIVENLVNQSVLAEIAWFHKEWKIRRAAVRKITNQDLLEKIFKGESKDSDSDVRKAAENRLKELRK